MNEIENAYFNVRNKWNLGLYICKKKQSLDEKKCFKCLFNFKATDVSSYLEQCFQPFLVAKPT